MSGTEPPDLATQISKFSLDCNHLLQLCRQHPLEVSLVKKQLAKVLESVKSIISFVAAEENVDEVKTSAVRLKNAIFKLFETPQSSDFSSVGSEERVLESVMEMLASIKYYVQSNAPRMSGRSDSSASLHSLTLTDPASNSRPSLEGNMERPAFQRTLSKEKLMMKAPTISDVDLVKIEVADFAKKCSDFVKYARGANLTPKGTMTQFFEIMESVRTICARKIRSGDIKTAAENFIAYAKKIQYLQTLDHDLKQELVQLTLALATAVKASVNEYTQKLEEQLSVEHLGQSVLANTAAASKNSPIAFAQHIPTVDIRRSEYIAVEESNFAPPSRQNDPNLASPHSSRLIVNFAQRQNRKSLHFKDGLQVDAPAPPKKVLSSSKSDSEDEFLSEEILREEGNASFSLLSKRPSKHAVKHPLQSHDYSSSEVLPVVSEADESAQSQRTEPSYSPGSHRRTHGQTDDMFINDEPEGIYFTPFDGTGDEAFQKNHVIQTLGPKGTSSFSLRSIRSSYGSIRLKLSKMANPQSDDGADKVPDSPASPSPVASSPNSSQCRPSSPTSSIQPPTSRSATTRSGVKSMASTKSDESQLSGPMEIELGQVDSNVFDARGVPQGDVIMTYEEEEVVMISRLVNGKTRIQALTIKMMIEKLANQEAQDHEYLRIFLLTFRHVLKPIDLINLLHQR